MATKEAIAKVREIALQDLKESTAALAKQVRVAAPDFGFYFHDKDLQQAEELKTLALFHKRVLSALKEGSHVPATTAKTSKPRR